MKKQLILVNSSSRYMTNQPCWAFARLRFIGPMKGYFRHPTLNHFFHPTLTFNPKLMSPDTDIQIWYLDAWHSTSARHWQSHFQVDAGHCTKFQVDAQHSDPPSWALFTISSTYKKFFFLLSFSISHRLHYPDTSLTLITTELDNYLDLWGIAPVHNTKC